MQYVTDLSKYQTENRTAVTLGKFDGLHRGHQELISRIQRFADQEKAESVVFAFDMGKEALMTGEEKKAYLEVRLLRQSVRWKQRNLLKRS